MIKIIRNIRRQLVSDKKTGNYLLYAAGEVILVVIGILIALQVNNWNESRKNAKEGQRIQQELYLEFSDNRTVLKERISALNRANESVRLVLNYINAEGEKFQKVDMDSLISSSLKYGNYNPSNSTINELIGSGRLNLISDPDLKKKLYAWLQLLEDTDEDFKNQDQQATTLLMPYLSKHLSIKNLNFYNGLGIEEKSTLFSRNYQSLFQELEFENLYQSKLFWNMIMLDHYRELDELAGEIMELSVTNNP